MSTSGNWGNDTWMNLFSSSLGPRLDHIQNPNDMINVHELGKEKHLHVACALSHCLNYNELWMNMWKEVEHLLVLYWKLLVEIYVYHNFHHMILTTSFNFKTVSSPRLIS